MTSITRQALLRAAIGAAATPALAWDLPGVLPLKLVPYASTELRVSVFPQVKNEAA